MKILDAPKYLDLYKFSNLMGTDPALADMAFY